MKRALILAYDFPPYVSVGGLRPYSWYKYLPEFNIYPIIVTRQWDNKHGNHLDYISASRSAETIIEESEKGTIIKAPYFPNLANKLMLQYGDSSHKFIRKLISAYYEFAQFLFFVGPKASLYLSTKEYLKKHKVDVIIATGDPFILFHYASKLSKTFNIPWIADYRDLWSQDRSIQQKYFRKIFNSYFEKQTVYSSSLIITVSDLLQINISGLIKNKTFSILPNGYDPEVTENIKNINQQSDVFSIAFIGTINNWHPIKSFFSVISQFIDKKKANLKVTFYGINIAYELNQILLNEFPQLINHIIICPKMSNKLLLHEVAKKNVMLLFNDYSIMGTKIYDYIGIKRTILLCYTNDNEADKIKKKYHPIKETSEINNHLQEDLIKKTNSGYAVRDPSHLFEILEQLYNDFKSNGYILCNTTNAENYSRKHQVKELAEIIKTVSSENKENLSY